MKIGMNFKTNAAMEAHDSEQITLVDGINKQNDIGSVYNFESC